MEAASKQFYIIMALLNKGTINLEDLDDFSDDLRKTIKRFLREDDMEKLIG